MEEYLWILLRSWTAWAARSGLGWMGKILI